MNRQKAPKGIEWTRVWGRNGYTWSPITGCHHACEWTMPDGKVAECYAKTIAESNRLAQFYPQGFNHHYFHEKRLKQPLGLQKGAGIFVDAMSDMFAHNVPAEQIQMILDVCEQASQHIFFVLTKNPVRLKKFKFPSNVWVGASSPPDSYMGKALTIKQKEAMMYTAFNSLDSIEASVKWISFEPLSSDYSHIVDEYKYTIDWAVIGGASNGRQLYAPDKNHFDNMMESLDSQNIPVFFKGNMTSLGDAIDYWVWRDNFPPQPHELTDKATAQPTLF